MGAVTWPLAAGSILAGASFTAEDAPCLGRMKNASEHRRQTDNLAQLQPKQSIRGRTDGKVWGPKSQTPIYKGTILKDLFRSFSSHEAEPTGPFVFLSRIHECYVRAGQSSNSD